MEVILLLILIVLLLIYKEIKALNVFQIVETDTFISTVKQLTTPIVIEHKLKFNSQRNTGIALNTIICVSKPN